MALLQASQQQLLPGAPWYSPLTSKTTLSRGKVYHHLPCDSLFVSYEPVLCCVQKLAEPMSGVVQAYAADIQHQAVFCHDTIPT